MVQSELVNSRAFNFIWQTHSVWISLSLSLSLWYCSHEIIFCWYYLSLSLWYCSHEIILCWYYLSLSLHLSLLMTRPHLASVPARISVTTSCCIATLSTCPDTTDTTVLLQLESINNDINTVFFNHHVLASSVFFVRRKYL